MTTLHRSFGIAALSLLVFGACDQGSLDDDVLRLVDEVITVGNDNVAIVCDCWDEIGFASRTKCLDDQILPSQRRCVEDAYLRDAAASKLQLDCVVPLLRELGECLDERLSCEAPEGTDACFSDYDLGRESCVDLPLPVLRALEDCGVPSSSDSASGDESASTDDTVGPPDEGTTTDDTAGWPEDSSESGAGPSGDPSASSSPDPETTAEESGGEGTSAPGSESAEEGPAPEGGSTTDTSSESTDEGGAPPCQWANDGECDEPEGTDLCEEGSDPGDC